MNGSGPSAGWYPDPGGSGQLRHWDGARWGSDLRPAGSIPSGPSVPGPNPPNRPPGRRGAVAVVIGVVTLVVVVAVVAVVLVVVRPWDRSTEITEPPPTPTISAGNDGDPTPTPTPTGSPTPQTTPTPSDDSTDAGPVACPVVNDVRGAYPADGRVHGGGLSFTEIPGWSRPTNGPLDWADDDASQRTFPSPGWFNFVAVGALLARDGFPTSVKAAARSASQCMVTSSGWYPSPTKVEVVTDQATTVSGRSAHVVSTDVYEPPEVTDDPAILGDRVTVVVVDTGTPGRLGVFVYTASLGRQEILDATAAATKTLRVG